MPSKAGVLILCSRDELEPVRVAGKPEIHSRLVGKLLEIPAHILNSKPLRAARRKT
jgi:hypothetical protein